VPLGPPSATSASPSASASPSSQYGTIAGTLTTSTGAPLTNTLVRIQPAGGSSGTYNSTYSTTGKYSFGNVVPGTYNVSFTVAGNTLTQWAHQEVGILKADQYVVVAGQTTTVDDTALPTGTISGHLVDRAGKPVPSASVEAFNYTTAAFSSGYTDASGAYTMAVFPGTYQVEFSFNGITQYAPNTMDQSAATVFQVAAGATITVDDTTVATGTASGVLTESDGTPVVGAYVEFGPKVGGSTIMVTTAADGSYTTGALAAGSYTVSFMTADYRRYQYAFGTTDYSKAATVAILADQNTTVSDKLLPTGTLTVTATDALTGKRITNLCVYAIGGGYEGNTCSDSAGVVTLAGLPEGSQHQLSISDSDYSYLTYDMMATVVAGTTTPVAVVLTPQAHISTTTVDAVTHQPVANVCVDAVPAQSFSLPDYVAECSDSTGKLQLGYLAAGTYVLYAFPQDGVHGIQWVGATSGTGDRGLAQQITVTTGATVTGPAIYLDKAGTISGTITDAVTGAPVQNACVGAGAINGWAGRAGECPGAYSDETGHYAMTNLGPYAWPVEFAGSYGYVWQWYGGVPSRKQATPVTVAAGTTTTIDAQLGHGITISGVMRDSAGNPETEGTIIPINVDSGDAVGAFNTAPDGTFTMHVLPQTIKIGYEGGTETTMSWYLNAVDAEHATPVNVTGPMTIDLVTAAN
jgi:Carboxypeptidase regulatory-like domain